MEYERMCGTVVQLRMSLGLHVARGVCCRRSGTARIGLKAAFYSWKLHLALEWAINQDIDNLILHLPKIICNVY